MQLTIRRPVFVGVLSLITSTMGWSATLTVGHGEGFDHPTLSAAIANAATNDTLSVAPGIYSVTSGETFPLAPMAPITIQSSSPEASPVVIGNGSDSVFLFDNIGSATLDGFEVRRGGKSGVYIDSTTATILNTVVRESTFLVGGGIYIRRGNVAIHGSRIIDNTAETQGGGIYLTIGNLEIVDCEISRNQASDAGQGGGVRAFRCPNLTIRNSYICENFAAEEGTAIDTGGLEFDVGVAVALIENCTITGNYDTRPGSHSIVHLDRYQATVRNTRIYENSTSQHPQNACALKLETFSGPSIHQSEIRDNTGMGGVHAGLVKSSLTLTDSLILRNEGVGLITSHLDMKNSQVSENGITGVAADTFQIADSIIADNFGSGIDSSGSSEFPEDYISAVTDTEISGNGAFFYESPTSNFILAGGAFLVTHTRFRDCQILNNRGGNFGAGGLVCIKGVTLEDCSIEGNSNLDGTAGVVFNGTDSVVTGCRFIGNSIDPNSESSLGNVIEVSQQSKVIWINSIYAANSTPRFSHILVSGSSNSSEQGSLTLLNCTVEGNPRVEYEGPDQPLFTGGRETQLLFVNSILWNGPDILSHVNPTLIHCNTEGEFHPGPGNISEDPLFFQPWNGTITDYRLPCHSPSVDSGTSEGAPSVDIDGSHRPRGVGYDMGAYENCGMDLNGDGEMDGVDYLIFTEEWMEPVTVDNKQFDFVTGPSVPNLIDARDLIELRERMAGP